MRLIDGDEVMNRLTKKKPGVANNKYTDGYNDAIMRFRSMIHGSPTIDAVPVVRCGKCKHREEKTFWCEKVQDFISNPEWFCAGGERKKGDE
jgi:hypothetical protein